MIASAIRNQDSDVDQLEQIEEIDRIDQNRIDRNRIDYSDHNDDHNIGPIADPIIGPITDPIIGPITQLRSGDDAGEEEDSENSGDFPDSSLKNASSTSSLKSKWAAEEVPDEATFKSLIETHLPLVRSIADRMRRRLPNKIEAEDLYSVGVTGLVSAARNFRPSQFGSFSSYATTRIRGAILDELRRMDWLSRATRSKAKRLGSVISRLEQESGGAVNHKVLSKELQMTEDELRELMEEIRPVKFVSLDSPEEMSDSDDQSLHEVIPDDNCAGAFDILERKELIRILSEKIAQLPEVPKKVLAMYYYEGMRLAQIAACFGLTESRICQIHTQAVNQLRNYLSNVLS
jgi:RNA polymerase sigma factor FliA